MHRLHAARSRQKGISLFIVMVMVLLTTLLVLWSSRTALFNEKITANDSDYQRALEAAQSMLRDAELDIKGENPDASSCLGPSVPTAPNGCRTYSATVTTAFYPAVPAEFTELQAALTAKTPSCLEGICAPDNVGDEFWLNDTKLAAMKATGAAYGQFTKAVHDSSVGNPILYWSTAAAAASSPRAWYWVEMLAHDPITALTGGGTELVPDTGMPIYRITAIAEGSKPGTRAVIQSVFIRKKKSI